MNSKKTKKSTNELEILKPEVESNGILEENAQKYFVKKAEYKLLASLIKNHKISIARGGGYNIQAIARILSINPKTARKWLESSKIQKLIANEMEYFISKMQETGSDDWRQWKAQVELARSSVEKQSKDQNQLNVVIISEQKNRRFEVYGEEDW